MILHIDTDHPASRSYVLKLHREAIPSKELIRGRLENMATGWVCNFTTGDELLACLTADLEAGNESTKEAGQ
jgi:hypothetical protein